MEFTHQGTQRTTPPTTAVPIDILSRQGQHITTNIPSNLDKEPNKPRRAGLEGYLQDAFPNLVQHIHSLVTWEQDDDTLHALLETQDAIIFAASDGGYDPQSGISTYGWVVASNQTVLVTGMGPAEAHPSLANSFRSEGYGAAAALLFLAAFQEFHNIVNNTVTLKLFIDNKSMVDRLNEYMTPWKRSNKHQSRPEVDITNTAEDFLGKFPKFEVRHVKSHQDDDRPLDSLPWSAQLNILADRLATDQRNQMTEPKVIVTNTTNGMLHIQNIAITRDAAQQLWQAASHIPILEYHLNRNSWANTTFQKVDWPAQRAALARFNMADQQRILKFVH
jgi:ribonuclease HI